MRFIFYLSGILNGDTSRFHIFMTVFTGAVGIACFAAAFNSLLNKIYGEDKDQ